jgi:hypothetical protein
MRARPALASIALLATAGCGGTEHAEPTRAVSGSEPIIIGAHEAERSALRAILHELAPTSIRSIRIAPTPNNLAVRLTIDAPGSSRGTREAETLASLYLDAARRLNLRPVSRVDSPGAGGGRSAQGHFVVEQVRPPPNLGLIREAIASTGVRTAELRVTAIALRVTVQTSDPATFLKRHYKTILDRIIDASPKRWYFYVEDGTGEAVYSYYQLGNTTGFGARPDLEACGPVSVIGRFGGRPSPCPA